MDLARLPKGARTALLALAAEVKAEGHRRQRTIVDDEGNAHTRGGTYGNSDREMLGYTAKDAAKARATLRAFSRRTDIGTAEGYLCQALIALYESRELGLDPTPEVQTGAQMQATYRRTRAEMGWCSIRTAACAGVAREGKTTCAACAADNTRRVREARQAKRRVLQAAPRDVAQAPRSAVADLLARLDDLARV